MDTPGGRWEEFPRTCPRHPTGNPGSGATNAVGTVLVSGLLSLVLSASAVCAADWPSWGGRPSRNMASETEKGLPEWYSPGAQKNGGKVDLSTTKNSSGGGNGHRRRWRR